MKEDGMTVMNEQHGYSSLKNNIVLTFFIVILAGSVIINILLHSSIPHYLLQEGLAPEQVAAIARHIMMFTTGSSIIGIIVVLLVSVFLSNTITKPMKLLLQGMLEMAGGAWSTRIEIKNDDEVGRLSYGFNVMAERLENSLKQIETSRQYTENILKSVPSILIALNERGNVLSINDAFERLREQYPGLDISQFINPIEREIKENLSTGETIRREMNITPEEANVTLIFSVTVSKIGDAGAGYAGERPSALLTITDVTERRKMKKFVLQSKQDWEDTFNAIPDMITIHDQDFNIIQANRAAAEILDLPILSPSRINKCFNYYHGTDCAPKGCPSCDTYRTGKAGTFEVYEPHLKRFIEIRSIPRLNSSGQVIGLIHIVRDTSDRMEIEKEHNRLLDVIIKAKVEWEQTFDSVSELILIIDDEMRITRCNRSFAEFIGEPMDDITGNRWYEFFPSSAGISEFRQILDEGIRSPFKIEAEMPDRRWLYISYQPMKESKAGSSQSIIVVTDITDMKNAQQNLAISEENLKKKVDDLEKFYDLAVGRELRMKELKKELKKTKAELARYTDHETAAK